MMLSHWYTAKFVKALTQPMITTLEIQSAAFQEFVKTWEAVYRPR